MTADEQSQATPAPPASETAAESAGGEAKERRASGDKQRRSHGERAMANVRAAKKGQREVSDPAERARYLLAEANVLALLDLADALRGSPTETEEPAAAE